MMFLQESALHNEICYHHVQHLQERNDFMKRKRKIFIVLLLVFYQIFCMIHIPLKLIPDNQNDVQISSVVHPAAYHVQNHQYLDSEQKVCDIAFLFCESVFFFAIAKFLHTVTKITVYIWQLPRGNIGGIMMKTN